MSRRMLSFSNYFILSNFLYSIDRWDYYKMYIQTVAVLVTDNNEGKTPKEDEPVDNTFEKCHDLLNEVIFNHFFQILNRTSFLTDSFD